MGYRPRQPSRVPSLRHYEPAADALRLSRVFTMGFVAAWCGCLRNAITKLFSKNSMKNLQSIIKNRTFGANMVSEAHSHTHILICFL